MKSGLAALCAAAVSAAVAFSAATAAAQTAAGATPQSRMKACAAEWDAKKAAHETEGLKYRDFVRECLSRTAAAPAAPESAPGSMGAEPQPPASRPPGPRTAAPAKPAAPGEAVFPSAVSQKYANQSAGRARMHTCLDQYNENKATGGNAGLKWIQKGGGYYSECNKRLKG
jgi:hypothetical protein